MYVGLTISNSEIKILSVKGRQVNNWGRLALADGLVRDGLILEPRTVGEAIADLFKSTKTPKDKVVVSLAGLSFTYRFLNLPRMKPAALEEAILHSASREISLPLEELYLSWQILSGKDEELSIFVLGIPRNLVDVVVETLTIAHVTPYLMDLRPLALVRAANRGNAIVVNLESDSFDIVFMADGIPTVIHTINPRSEGATFEDNIRRLADEFVKTVTFYQSNHPENQLSPATPVLLTGDLSVEPLASEMLQAEIDYPIELLEPQVNYPAGFPVASYTASIGLALKKTPPKQAAGGDAVRFQDININILAGKYRKPRKKPLSTGLIIFTAVLVIAVASLYPLYQARSQLSENNAGLQAEFDVISREFNIASLIAEESSLKEEVIQEIISNTEMLKLTDQSILSPRGEFTRDLELVTDNLPLDTQLTAIEISNGMISILGETDSVFTVVDYATALESIESFSEVRITELHEAILGSSEDEDSETELTEDSRIVFRIFISK